MILTKEILEAVTVTTQGITVQNNAIIALLVLRNIVYNADSKNTVLSTDVTPLCEAINVLEQLRTLTDPEQIVRRVKEIPYIK